MPPAPSAAPTPPPPGRAENEREGRGRVGRTAVGGEKEKGKSRVNARSRDHSRRQLSHQFTEGERRKGSSQKPRTGRASGRRAGEKGSQDGRQSRAMGTAGHPFPPPAPTPAAAASTDQWKLPPQRTLPYWLVWAFLSTGGVAPALGPVPLPFLSSASQPGPRPLLACQVRLPQPHDLPSAGTGCTHRPCLRDVKPCGVSRDLYRWLMCARQG